MMTTNQDKTIYEIGCSQEFVPVVSFFHEVLDYNKDTGVFTWKERHRDLFENKHQWCSWNSRCAGKVAGSQLKKKNKTYLIFSVKGKRFYAHRVAWLMTHGKWPELEIDHINGDSTDNSISNLREVNRKQNCRNMKLYKTNKSGYAGVSWHERENKWRARVMFNGKEFFCGLYDDVKEAALVVNQKRKELGFHENHGLTLKGEA
ncbi:MAG TPA: HNH endonuclease [Methylophaga aminisulfidivorans]|uniref:HNH endonuclease n=2 Tax=root TaxID=1 RepID=A0A7C1VVY0_9GAMM|nr:HNH endonuclease [Methylophaga aminisulfidivorans]